MKKAVNVSFQIIILLSCFILGGYFLFQNVGVLKSSAFALIGIALIILSCSKIYTHYQENKKILKSAILVALIGVLLLFNLSNLVFVVFAILLLFEPLFNIAKSKDKKQQFFIELPEIIFAIVLLLITTTSFFYAIIFRILGIVLIVIGLYQAICVFSDDEIKSSNEIEKKNLYNDIIDQKED